MNNSSDNNGATNKTMPASTKKKFNLIAWQEGGVTDFAETCFAEYWDKLPTIQQLCISCDPYNWSHRMALGKYIIQNTGSRELWGPNFSGHWHWAYLAQLDWLKRSGRLASPVAKVTKRMLEKDDIAMDSWFAYVNLNSTVALYFGAAKAGLVPKVSVCKDCGLDLEVDPGFLGSVDIWHCFWINSHKKFLDSIPTGKGSKDKAIALLYQELWSAHALVTKSLLPRARKLELFLPELERKFGIGWLNMVEVYDAMAWNLLSLDALMDIGVGYSPSRVLNEESMIWLEEHCPDEHIVATTIIGFHNLSPATISAMRTFFQRLIRWDRERLLLPYLIRYLNAPKTPIQKLSLFFVFTRMLIEVILPQTIIEVLIWIFFGGGILLLSYYPLIRHYFLTFLAMIIAFELAKRYVTFISNL
mmetsp:Transcript_28613/g.59807  ORF Transcript_28613/g.59807 Transcript_28613/m.59807 type:complete len:416 (+) Transcript_28613:48-1295(+)